MDKKLDIITIGESLIELSSNQKFKDAECFHKYYGGDSLVCAIAAARLNSKAGFISCLGEDSFKEFMLDAWQKENLDTSYVRMVSALNGFYMVSRISPIEKEFEYYRKKTAASLLSIDDIDEDYIKSSKIIYSSGITQSLSISAREAVKKAFRIAKENGVITAYDPNYYSSISTIEDAKEYFAELSQYIDIILLSEKHDSCIFEIETKENISKYLTDIGISTVVIKSGKEKGYFIYSNGNISFVKFYFDNVVDTTSSGDAFNGAFLHAVAKGYSPKEAAQIASIDSGIQAQGIGAVKSTPYYDEVYNIYNSERI